MVTDAFWTGYRRQLKATEPATNLLCSLWVDWFEDIRTVEAGFSAVIGNDVRDLQARQCLRDPAAGPLLAVSPGLLVVRLVKVIV